MSNGQDVTISLSVQGAQRGAADIAEVDRELNSIGRSATRSGAAFRQMAGAMSVAHMARIRDTFRDTGISVNSASAQVEKLIKRMQGVARENAFKTLASEANLSTIQIARLRAQMGDYAGSVRSLAQGAASAKLAIAGVAAGAIAFGKTCLDAQIEMERLETSYRAVFGSQASAQLQEIYEQSNRIGLKFQETAEFAKGFFAAFKGTALESEMQAIFRSVTDTGAALQLSSDDVGRALLAMSQMISKGKVQAEELRGQFGEVVPGAFQMAAKAMGMTTAELDKFMADGKLTAEDLLPKLARALGDEYGKAAENAANTVQGSINRMETEWTRFKARIMDSGPVVFAVDFISRYLKEGNDAAAADIERERVSGILQKNGVAFDGVDQKKSLLESISMGGLGGFIGAKPSSGYSDATIRTYQAGEAQVNAAIEIQKKLAAQRDKELEDARAAYTKHTKDTPQKKLSSYRDEIASDRAKLVKQYENAKKSGNQEVTAGWEKNLKEFDAATGEKIRQLQDKVAKVSASAGKSASSAARKAAVSQADYSGELERTRQNIESLQAQLGLDKSETLAQAKIRIEQKYQEAISKTNEEIAKRVARGQISRGEADTLQKEKTHEADLERQLATRDAEQKAEERAIKTLETRVGFYKDLEAISGRYGMSLEYQYELIERQGKAWIEAGICVDDVAARLDLMRQEISDNPFDGLIRGARKFGAQYGDIAAQVEDFTTQMGSTIGNTLADAFMKGKFSAQDFFSSLIGMAAQAASNQFIGMIFSGLGGMFSSGPTMDSGMVSAMDTVNNSFFSAGGILHSGGIAGAGTPADGFRALPSGIFRDAPRFHSGGGFLAANEYPAVLLRGERVLNPSETKAYNAGQASMAGGWNCQPIVNVTVVNESGQQIDAQSKATPNSSGGFDLQIIVAQVGQAIVGRAKSGKSQLMQYQEKAYGMNRAGVLARGRGRA